MPKLRYGHAPGHVRDTAMAAFEAWLGWDYSDPEPTVEYEIHYEPHQISISRACGLVWNCTDIVPGWIIDEIVVNELLPIKSRTYAAVARAIIEDMRLHRKVAA
jgi:hypothetical protein